MGMAACSFAEFGVGFGAPSLLWPRIRSQSSRSSQICCALGGHGGQCWREAVGRGVLRQGYGGDGWSGCRGRKRRSSRVAAPVGAMGEDTMWVTAAGAVTLVLALATFAAVGGFLLSMGLDNEIRSEEEEIDKLKEQGLYKEPEPTQYEEQGVGTRTRNRRISKE